VHGLVGLSHEKMTRNETWHLYDESITETYSGSHNSFGFAVGGGLDIAITDSIAIRVIQADYFTASHPERFLTNFTSLTNEDEIKPGNRRYNNLNLSFGLVFRFGNR
jgi:hypothetical protein